MLTVIAVIVSAIAAWVLVDHLLSWRNERMHRGPSGWSEFGPAGKVIHSAGFEDTQPPAEAGAFAEAEDPARARQAVRSSRRSPVGRQAPHVRA